MPMLSLDEAIELELSAANAMYRDHLSPGLMQIYRILGLAEMDVVSAEGVEIRLKDGRTILDFSSSIGVLGLGHNHPRILAAERKCHDLKLIDAIKVAPHKLQAALAHNLAEILPDPLQYSFFTVSGAEAVESAMKLCERAQGAGRKKFVSMRGSFHGKTHGALAMTTSGGFHDGFLLGLPEEHIVEAPFGDSAALDEILKKHRDSNGECEVIAVILEPIQGQDLSVAPPGYLQSVIDCCRTHGVLTIFDEVKIGMGRTGTFCSFQADSVVPDVVTLSKSLGGGKRAVGVMVASRDVFLKAYGKRSESSLHTTTFGGLGQSCAVAIETLNVLVEEGLIDQARTKGEYLKGRLRDLQEKHPGKISELRGRGLLQGVRFDFNRQTLRGIVDLSQMNFFRTVESVLMGAVIRELFHRYGLLVHICPSDPDILHVMPPLVVETEQLDTFVDAIDDILRRGLIDVVSRFVAGNVKGLFRAS